MTKWLALYDFGLYDIFCRDGDFITCKIDDNFLNKLFFDIKSGDIVVYYEVGIGRIVGIYEVLSDDFVILWSYKSQYCAKNTKKLRGFDGNYLDFKQLSKSVDWQRLNISAMHEKKQSWSTLDDHDYNIITSAYANSSLIRQKDDKICGGYGQTGFIPNPEVSAGLLDYYNSRATSFSSLFVASIFGLVTLAAIIQSLFSNYKLALTGDLGVIIISLGIYATFILAGYYTLRTYFHYAILSDKIKSIAIDRPFKEYLERTWHCEMIDGKRYETNLWEIITDKELNHSKGLMKQIIQMRGLVIIAYVLAILALSIIIYWGILPSEWQASLNHFWAVVKINRQAIFPHIASM